MKVSLSHKVMVYGVLFFSSCLPTPVPYPYQTPATIVTRAQAWSDSLQAYVYKWTRREVPATIPNYLIPKGISDSKNFYLKNPDSVTAEETWAVRYAKPINKDSLYAGIPDPRITYLFLGTALAPFGSKLVIEGEFPHCRFFSLQISPPLNGKEYYAQRQYATAEVSVADVDINPLPGSVNPFKVGANRNATNRKYRYEFDLTTGNPTTLNNTAHTYPYLDNSKNLRKGAMLVYQGPLGYKNIAGINLPNNEQGDWNLGCLWLRVYDPDKNTNAMGGVGFPKVYYQLPTGEKYFIGSDFSILQRRADTTIANRVTTTNMNTYAGPEVGWYKSWGITRSILNGVSQANGWNRVDSGAKIRAIDLGWTGRGEMMPAPGNIEPHATTNNYATYLGRSVAIPPGMVAVLTGKLPSFPKTSNGASVMTKGDVRYWSICGIDTDPFSPLPATTANAIYDSEVNTDVNGNYIIAYSRQNDKPLNATASNGISWVNWGTQSELGLLMRWVNVAPDWRFTFAPQEHNLDFSHSDWSGMLYDSTLIGVNWRNGFMQCYLPRIHYMSKAAFEALGNNLTAEKIPVWLNDNYKNGAADSRLGVATASSVLDATPANLATNANDGNINTAWSSAFGATEASITIDLQSAKTISGIKLLWDFFLFAKTYTISTSMDGTSFTNIINASNQNGSVDLYDRLANIKARYIRLNATQPNIFYYRLTEFEVYTSDCDCKITTTDSNNSYKQIPIKLYPVPANNYISYSIPSQYLMKDIYLQIISAEGKIVYNTRTTATSDVIPLQQLRPSTYYFKITVNKEVGITKFVKI